MLFGNLTSKEKKINSDNVKETIKNNQLILAKRSESLTKAIVAKDAYLIAIDRLIIGDGVAGTMVYDQLPLTYRSTERNGIPNVLVISDPSNTQQWDKHNLALMGQQENVQVPVAFTHKPSEFSRVLRDPSFESKTNPYGYTRGEDFASALRATQVDMGMKTLPAILTKVETQDNSWPNDVSSYKYRATLDINGTEKVIYVNHIDICAGFGQSRKLQESGYTHRHTKAKKPKQIDTDLSKKLIQNGKLIYANDNAYPDLLGDVLVFGGSAMAGAVVADILYKNDPKVKLIKWVSGSVKDLNDTRDTNRMNKQILDTDLDKNLSLLSLGDIEKVEELYNGKIKVTFMPVPKLEEDTGPIAQKIKRSDTEFSVICDHLVVAIGSENNLTKVFQNIHFKNIHSSSVHSQDKIHVGTQSDDSQIITWGASGRGGFGLKDKDWQEYVEQRDQTNLNGYVKTLPPESRGCSTILSSERAILTQAKALRKKRQFPLFDREKRKKNINNVSAMELTHKLEKLIINLSEKNITNSQRINLILVAKGLSDLLITLRMESPEGITVDRLKKCGVPQALVHEIANAFHPFEDDAKSRRSFLKK